MNINEDIRNKRGKRKICKGCANKISYISAARCSLLPMWYKMNAKTHQVLYNSRLVV